MRSGPLRVIALLALAGSVVVAGSAATDDSQLVQLEAAASADPENLWRAAEYRQRAIALGAFDRAVKTLGRLADRPDAGPNVYISLGLAYVDKVPAVSAFRRIFVGRDAMDALSRSIDRRPSFVAYYVRGVINLYYPDSVFHRARRGIADLQRARDIAAAEPPRPYHVRAFISLGDGYWKIDDLATARTVWAEGLQRFAGDAALTARLNRPEAERNRLIKRALDPATRVDTSLRELFPAMAVGGALR